MNKNLIICFVIALILPLIGYAAPKTAAVQKKPAKTRVVKKAPAGKSVVCQKGKRNKLVKTQAKGKNIGFALPRNSVCCL